MIPHPNGWSTLKVAGVVCSITGGLSLSAAERPALDGEHGILTLSAVSYGTFNPKANKAIIEGDQRSLGPSVRSGTVLISRSNSLDFVGACAYADRDYPNLHLPDLIWELSVDESRIDPEWLYYALTSPGSRSQIRNRVTGTSASMKKLSMASLRGMDLDVPPLPEQRAISNVLSAWDRGIRQLSDLIAAKVRFKQGLMQQLLTGQRRFKGSRGEWPTVQLRDVTTECDERNRGQLGGEVVMAVTKAEGIVPMRERTIGASIVRYQIVRKDWFAYNPMRINIGSIARWGGDREILVSPDYVVFRCNEANGKEPVLDPDYLDHLRRSNIWEKFVSSSGNGSVRVRIYYSDLGHMKFPLPPFPEQRKIAAFLNTHECEIDLLRTSLKILRQQKQGLMQKLLTGEVRVPASGGRESPVSHDGGRR